ncbi:MULTISPECIES: pyruvate kinase [unclassified Lentilitoribacter]|jgi:pyruvate kinase|uniref:pyruvate kinase n=1 Tax=unclassified Lentilitoribacter TaxID=2647570 RepID=UPI0013A6D074|nr:pyruvate kinase [Lentilitoribacter sp. Alg239-R112]
MRRKRKVKILATLGPASSDEATIKRLYEAGADVFRINMSHSSHEVLNDLISKIRKVEKKCGRPIGILADIQGPKLRVGTFVDGSVELEVGQSFKLDGDETPGNKTRVYLPHPEILQSVKDGDRLLIDDGRLQLKATKCDGKTIETVVVSGTKISNKKGVSLPDTDLAVGALTPKDRSDLGAIMENGSVDWIALSFIQRPEDLIEVRDIVGKDVCLMSKIEKPQALDQIDEIIELSDAIMVARGDLGVEMPIESVPGIQKQLIRSCRRKGKPVVVATQMLESMITAPVPTRAEVSDVATAVFEGADAVMLSAESAAGDYPVEAVLTMASIARGVEHDPTYLSIIHAQRAAPDETAADAISLAARQTAETLDLPVIVCYTSSGATGIRASRERPNTPIIALTPVLQTARRMTIVWAVHPVVTATAKDLDDMVDRACRISEDEGFAKSGDQVIITAGVPLGRVGTTNMLRIANVGDVC